MTTYLTPDGWLCLSAVDTLGRRKIDGILEDGTILFAYGITQSINVTDSGVGADVLASLQENLSLADSAAGTESINIETLPTFGRVLIDGLFLSHALKVRISEPTVMASKPVSQGLPTRIYLGKQGRIIDIDGWVDKISDLNTITALADGNIHSIQLPTANSVSVHIIQAQPTRQTAPYQQYPYTIHAEERMD
jgi:hypothetical protein